MTRRPRLKKLFPTILTVCGLIILAFALSWTIESALHHHETLAELEATAQAIELSQHAIFQALATMSDNQSVQDTLGGLAPTDNPEVLLSLGLLQQVVKADLIYLLDANGLTLACTPFGSDTHETLTGQNYAFRPYFREIIQGKRSQAFYAALGVSTNERGLYLATAIMHNQNIVGVIVAKMGLCQIDKELAKINSPIALISPEGIIFASNQDDWLFKAAWPLNAEQMQGLQESRQFANQKLPPLQPQLVGPSLMWQQQAYTVHLRPVLSHNWRLLRLIPLASTNFPMVIGFSTILILIFALLERLYYYSRRQKLTVKSLSDSEQHHRLLFEDSPDAYMVLENGVISDCNRACLAMFNCEKARLIGLSPADISPPQQADGSNSVALAVRNQQIAEQWGRLNFEWQHRRFDGQDFWVDVSVAFNKINERKILLCSIRDINQRKATEQKLARLYAETERMNALMTGREERVMELKREVNKLAKELGQGPIYPSVNDL
jgi:PAS domain S-box-containing protein